VAARRARSPPAGPLAILVCVSAAEIEIVNPVGPEETGAWVRTMATTFLQDPGSERTVKWIEAVGRLWEPQRAWGARAGGQWVGTLRTESRALTVPEGPHTTAEVRADAVTNVTVAATHRRRGILSRMLGSSLRAAKERGDPLSMLIAAEWSIYGRFGYAPATLSAEYVLRRSRAGSALAGDPSRLRQVDREEFAGVALAVFDAARRDRAGQVDRRGDWWKRVLGLDGYPRPDGLPHNWLIHEGVDGADGLLAWKATNHAGLIPPLDTAEVWSLVAGSDTAYRNLWAYLGGLDLIDEVRLPNRPVDEPVRWLLHDARTLVLTEIVDLLWLRLLDIPAALAARRYATAGEVTLEVHDEAGLASGRFRLRTDGGEASCEPTDRPADLEIAQRRLASIYLGGFRLLELAGAGGVREHTPGALAKVDLMFSTPLAPWNATWF